MSATIMMENHRSIISAQPEVISDLRKHVAYQDHELPPVWVQYQLKHWLGTLKENNDQRYGYETDIERLHYAKQGRILESKGWTIDRWTRNLFENTCRQKGLWDGYKSLITRTGEFGTGLVPHVQRALTLRMGLSEARLVDHRKRVDMSKPLGRRPDLWSHQEEALGAWRACGYRGVVELPPRTGKTRLAAACLHEIGLPALVLVPRVEIAKQTVKKFIPIFGEASVIGVTGGQSRMSARKARRMINAPIWVATPKTAISLQLDTRAVLVFDEFHHAAAKQYREVSKKCFRAFYRLGLTGTHFRADGRDLIMHSVMSSVAYRRSIKECVEMGRLVSARAALVRTRGQEAGLKIPDQEYRNQLIVWCAAELARRGKRVLVLCTEVRHVEALTTAIPGAVGVDGRDTPKGLVRKALDDLEARRVPCVVGTSVIGEGVDVPAADAMVYAAGNRSKVKVIQDVFRILTADGSKSHGVLIDFADDHDDRSCTRAAERLHYYRANGFEADPVDPSYLPVWLDAAG